MKRLRRSPENSAGNSAAGSSRGAPQRAPKGASIGAPKGAAKSAHRSLLDDKPQLVNPAYPPEPAPTGRVDTPDDVVDPHIDLEQYGVAATGWKPFWRWFVGIFKHDWRWWSHQIAFLVVFAMIIVAVGFVAADHWRRGATVVASTALLAAALRSFLPVEYVNMLDVRSRRFDVIFLLITGSLLIFLVVTVPA